MTNNFEQAKDDLQRTVREIIRVLIQRRWMFFIPFCVGATGVFIFSHNMPRVYKAHTIFERRNTIPIAKVLGPKSRGPESTTTMRQSIAYDMLGVDAMTKVADKLGLTKTLSREQDGLLTESAKAQRKAIAERLKAAVSYSTLQAGEDLDRVRIDTTGSDPELVVKLANTTRDTYFEYYKTKYLGTLADARAFYQREIDGAIEDMNRLETELGKLEEEYPYINPQKTDSDAQQSAFLKIRQENLERQIKQIASEVEVLEARLKSMPIPKLMNDAEVPAQDMEFLSSKSALEAQKKRLQNDILVTREAIERLRIERGMRDKHPDMQLLMRKEQQTLEDLAAVNLKLEDFGDEPVIVTRDPVVAEVQQMERNKVMFELSNKKATLESGRYELKEIQDTLAVYEQQKQASLAKRPEYRLFKQELDKTKSILEESRVHERELSRLLDIDQKDQGIEFITLEEADTTRRPVLPKLNTVLMLAFGIGITLGTCMVFFREFFDHTFHTASAVSYSLGIQILEGIDEILLPAERQRRLVRKLVTIPIACILMLGVVTAGGLAYLSIEQPNKYKKLVIKATDVWKNVDFMS